MIKSSSEASLNVVKRSLNWDWISGHGTCMIWMTEIQEERYIDDQRLKKCLPPSPLLSTGHCIHRFELGILGDQCEMKSPRYPLNSPHIVGNPWSFARILLCGLWDLRKAFEMSTIHSDFLNFEWMKWLENKNDGNQGIGRLTSDSNIWGYLSLEPKSWFVHEPSHREIMENHRRQWPNDHWWIGQKLSNQ